MANSNSAADFLTMLLAGAGASLSPGSAPVANMVVGQMATKNYGKMISDLLAGGGKLSADAENVSIKAPTNAFAGMLGTGNPSSYTPSNQGLPTLQQRMGGAGVQTPTNVSAPGQGAVTGTGGLARIVMSLLGGGVNPTSSPLAGANLVGLTPEHINSAMKLKMMQDQLAGERVKTILGSLQKPKDERTSDIKNYEYAVSQGFKGSFEDFKTLTSTAGIKDYEYARSQGYEGTYEQWKTDIAKAGSSQINIGESAFTRQVAVDKAKVMDPEFVNEVREEVSKQSGYEAKFADFWDKPETKHKVVVRMREQILQAFPDAQHGVVNGVMGWYRISEDGTKQLIQRNPYPELYQE